MARLMYGTKVSGFSRCLIKMVCILLMQCIDVLFLLLKLCILLMQFIGVF